MPVNELLAVQSAVGLSQVPNWGQIDSGNPASAISVGASPFTYQNTAPNPGLVIVSGGTVTTISYSRDGTNFFLVGLLAGMYHMSPGDQIRVVYVLTPQMTFVPF